MGRLRYSFSSPSFGRPYAFNPPEESSTDDNSCVVFDGSNLIFASEGERSSKIKHDSARPDVALRNFKDFSTVPGAKDVEGVFLHEKLTDHHLNHIFETFYQSGFNDAAVIVNDGHGNLDDCITFAYVRENEDPIVLKKFEACNSPCGIYSSASEMIFGRKHCEGKLMGLAAYGNNNGKAYIQWDGDNKRISTDENLLKRDVARCSDGADLTSSNAMSAKNIAFTVQKNFEETLCDVAVYFKHLLEDGGYKTENLCLSGGGVLNCPTNSKIVEQGLFQHYYASPQPGDGCAESVGRVLRRFYEDGEALKSKRLQTAYLGVTYPSKLIETPHSVIDNPTNAICEYLQRGGVVAWFQDGAEFGPRALGHRSFLADPAKEGMLDSLNKIKGREPWRPLAPIVPERLFRIVFDVDNTDMCEFMLRTLKLRERWQDKLGAVCHVDKTTRPQLLKREVNPILYDLLMTYYEQTGVPCLVNTSLNINGFPIVETPVDLCAMNEEFYYMDGIPDIVSILIEGNTYNLVWKNEGRTLD